jgi:hypothetical protein
MSFRYDGVYLSMPLIAYGEMLNTTNRILQSHNENERVLINQQIRCY